MAKPRFVVCSERAQKPLTRAVCESRPEAEKMLEELKQREELDPEDSYWCAEVGPESDAWRWLVAVGS